MKRIYTTAGALTGDEFGMALPHEHIFTETGEAPARAYLSADAADVLRVMKPFLTKAKEAGVTLLFEATPVGVGRRADNVAQVARACGLPVALATGFYREPWITPETRKAEVETLAAFLVDELNRKIAGTDVRAGFIKLGTSDDGMTDSEEKLLRAALDASRQTGAAICSHTTSGAVASRIIDVFEEEGVSPSRFVWFHAACEPDYNLLLRAAHRGAFLSLDYHPETTLPLVLRLAEDGLLGSILLSMDSGWYNPQYVSGGAVNGYTRMQDELFPKLTAALGADALSTITHDNVFRAYAR